LLRSRPIGALLVAGWLAGIILNLLTRGRVLRHRTPRLRRLVGILAALAFNRRFTRA
jgi:hypothetical protein